MKRLAVAVTATVLSIALAACGGSRGPFYSMPTLQRSVQATAQQKLGSSLTISSVTCDKSGAQTAVCHVTDTLGNETNLSITINQAGTSWYETGND